jgi:hypothetical protein
MTWLIELGCATHGDLNDDLGGGTSDGSCVGNQARQCQRGLWEPGMASEVGSPRLVSEKLGIELKLF